MDSYRDFASVYDTFMDETPYEEWCAYFEQVISKYGISRPKDRGANQCALNVSGTSDSQEEQATAACAEVEGLGDLNSDEVLRSERDLVLDLGCGTGTLTEMMAAKGYDMIGVDLSEEMLAIAMEKRQQAESGTLYLCQDMRDFELYSTVGTVLSVCDSLNYLLTEEDVLQTFQLVNNYLYPGGIFLFDFNTVYKYETIIGDTTIAESREECSFIWENFYDPEEQLNEYDLTIFVKTQDYETSANGEDKVGDASQGQDVEPLFRRFQETHVQRGYTLEQMTRLVEAAGMKVEFALDADTHEDVTVESERIYILAREVMKHE